MIRVGIAMIVVINIIVRKDNLDNKTIMRTKMIMLTMDEAHMITDDMIRVGIAMMVMIQLSMVIRMLQRVHPECSHNRSLKHDTESTLYSLTYILLF